MIGTVQHIARLLLSRSQGVTQSGKDYSLSGAHATDNRFCSEKGDRVPCDRYFGESNCAIANEFCEWHANVHMCLDKGKPVPCHLHTMQAACTHDEHCLWDSAAYLCKHKGAELHCNK